MQVIPTSLDDKIISYKLRMRKFVQLDEISKRSGPQVGEDYWSFSLIRNLLKATASQVFLATRSNATAKQKQGFSFSTNNGVEG